MILLLATLVGLTLVNGGNDPGIEAKGPPPFEEILKIDVHSHVFDEMPEFVEMLRRTNMRVVNICVYGTRPELLEPAEQRAEDLYQKYRGSLYFASTFDLTRREEPDYAEQVIAWLDRTFEADALMVKIWKEVGMELKKPDGAYLMPDDPVFDPIYEHLVKRGKPLMAHVADPIDAWLPLDPSSVHYAYFSRSPKWHVYGRENFPSHADILAARDNIMVKHPDLVVIGAHLGSMAHDVAEVAKRLDRFANFYVDVSARTPVLRQQPRDKVREFFIKYQDRILYGLDASKFTERGTPSEEERVAFTKEIEKTYRADYLYFAGEGTSTVGGRETECLALPRDVLEKFYHKNAQRLIPALAE
jgi:predicted TIM-barrel fold metal-dependent hydrolase